MSLRPMHAAMVAVLAWHGAALGQDVGVRLPELRFETLRPGATLLRGNDMPDEGFDYSTVNDPLGADVSAGIHLPLSRRLSTLLETTQAHGIGLTSEWSMLGQVGASLGRGWGLSAGLRHSELGMLEQPLGSMPHIAAGSADLGMLSVERYWNAYRGSFTYFTGRADDGASGSGHRIAVHYFYGERNSVGLSYTQGPALGLGTRTTDDGDLRNMGITGEHWFTRSWAVNYNALVEEIGDRGLRPELRLGLRLRF